MSNPSDDFYTALKTINTHVKGLYPPNKTFAMHVSLRDLQDLCHLCSRRSGWWEGVEQRNLDEVIGTKFVLIHSEISESMEGFRKNKMDDHLKNRKAVEVEMADAIIRILDTAEYLGLNIAEALMEKLAYNATRADHKPENRKKDGGKKF